MAAPSRPPDRNGFHIAVVCALKLEANAVDLLFDEIYDQRPYGRATADANTYTTGRIGDHAVVLLLLPSMGPLAAASGSAGLRTSYPNLKLALLVGICGGLPRIDGRDTLLGDVVISTSIFNYDFGRQYPDTFVPKTSIEDSLGQANKDIRGLLASLGRERELWRLRQRAASNLDKLRDAAKKEGRQTDYNPPADTVDIIFPANYPHRHRRDCGACDAGVFCEEASVSSCTEIGCNKDRHTSTEDERRRVGPVDLRPRIFMGRVASGNTVMKSGQHRDEIAEQHGVIAFEMEGAGAWEEVPCIVVKGICDYADSHKSKLWQSFAAAAAASVAVAILDRYEVPGVAATGAAAPPSPEPPIRATSGLPDFPVINNMIHSYSGSGHILQGNSFHGGGNTFNFGGSAATSDGPHWLVPRAATPLFTGRSSIIHRIKQALTKTETHFNQHKIFVVTGIGGQGKSEVCLQVVNLVRKFFWGVFWVDVSIPASANADFSHICRLLGSPASADAVQQARMALANVPPGRRWLLILDNADDRNTDYHNYLPSGSNGAILVTSRLRSCEALNTAGSEHLDDMDPVDCVKLLLKAAGIRNGSPENQHAAERVVELLGRHTLALVLAGIYISQKYCSLAEYPVLYDEQQEHLLKFAPDQLQPLYRTVYATFEASVQVLEQSDEREARDALDLLGLFSVLHFKNIPLDLLQDAWAGSRLATDYSEHDARMGTLSRWHVGKLPELLQSSTTFLDFRYRLRSAVSRLRSLAIVTDNESNGFQAVSLHPLVHNWLVLRQRGEGGKWEMAGACMLALSQFSLDRRRQLYGYFSGAHFRCLLEKERWLKDPRSPSKQEMQILVAAATYLGSQRRIRDLDGLHCWMCEHLESQWRQSSEDEMALADRLFMLTSVGNANFRRMTPSETLELRKTAFQAAEPLPDSNITRLRLQELLATAYLRNGQQDTAIRLLEGVIHIRTSKLGQSSFDHNVLVVKQELAGAYLEKNQIKRAITLLEEVVEAGTRIYEENDPDQLNAQHELGSAYLCDNQPDKAAQILEQVVHIGQKFLEQSDPLLLCTKLALVVAYKSGNHTPEALDLIQQLNPEALGLIQELRPEAFDLVQELRQRHSI